MLAMHIIAHFFPIFGKFPEAVITKSGWEKRRGAGGQSRGWSGGGSGVVGNQWCCGINIKCFCFTLIVIFHVQVEVQVEFTYLSFDGVE